MQTKEPSGSLRVLRALLVLPYEPATFMHADIDILARHFDLDTIVHNRGKARLGLAVLRRFVLNRPDVLVMWFIVPSYALALTLLAKFFGIKVAFITGGYDIVSMPKIGFGAMRFPLFRVLFKPTMWLADLVMPFSKASGQTLRKYGRPRRLEVVYPGVDAHFFTPDAQVEREGMAITVSPVSEISVIQKGLRTFVEAARYAPEMQFVLVGRSYDGALDKLRQDAPPNVEFIDHFIPSVELRDLYRKASCYIQASVHEGFGIAVAEAMLCGAMPVTTRRFSLPEVTGGLDESIPLENPKATAKAALRTIGATSNQREALRERIAEMYPPKRREEELTKLMLDLIGGTRRRIGSEGDLSQTRKLDLGCGSLSKPGFLGIDRRPTRATAVVADAHSLPIAPGVIDEVQATCLLEHFDAPSLVLNEVHRVLKPTGRAIFRLPNLGTYSSHLDTTHRYLADLAIWRALFEGYFGQVDVHPVGTKYRDSRSLVMANWVAVNLFKWYELAQGWDFICTEPRPQPSLNYVGWWEEDQHEGRIGGQPAVSGH